MPDPRNDDVVALRIRRLEFDIDDLRVENARLKKSITQQQNEITRIGEHEAALLSDIAELEGQLSVRVLTWWPVQAALRRLNATRTSKL